jgi:hypothetical protein
MVTRARFERATPRAKFARRESYYAASASTPAASHRSRRRRIVATFSGVHGFPLRGFAPCSFNAAAIFRAPLPCSRSPIIRLSAACSSAWATSGKRSPFFWVPASPHVEEHGAIRGDSVGTGAEYPERSTATVQPSPNAESIHLLKSGATLADRHGRVFAGWDDPSAN